MTPRFYEKGDKLLGERIAAEARKVTKYGLIQLTGGHKGTRFKLRGSAYCVIELPLKSVPQKSK